MDYVFAAQSPSLFHFLEIGGSFSPLAGTNTHGIMSLLVSTLASHWKSTVIFQEIKPCTTLCNVVNASRGNRPQPSSTLPRATSASSAGEPNATPSTNRREGIGSVDAGRVMATPRHPTAPTPPPIPNGSGQCSKRSWSLASRTGARGSTGPRNRHEQTPSRLRAWSHPTLQRTHRNPETTNPLNATQPGGMMPMFNEWLGLLIALAFIAAMVTLWNS